MKSYLFSTLSAALFVAGVSAQLTINTPANVVQCTPVQISWTGGTAPYILSVFPGATPDTGVLETFSNITGNSYTFTVNFATGTSLDLSLRDNSGLLAQTAPFTVQSGGSTGCLSSGVPSGTAGTVANTAATSASSNPTTAAGTNTGASAGNNPTTGASKAANSGSSTPTTSASKPSSSSNAAMATGIAYGAAGVLGAIVAAVFV